ncbi:NAD(P)-binding protein [Undibacterium sp. SXout20W]|uniref:NAD(P)-binding protein n=1 Tax=Undibacterium sp. SXout20W TaxID=3413051 RepID=UPI003BF14E52
MRSSTLQDLTPVINLAASIGVGAHRSQRPLYVDLLPPCNEACPAGENIQSWLAYAQAGQDRLAWEAIVKDNPFPAIHGRACYHPCESKCNRKDLDSAVSIHAVERYLGDQALLHHWTLPVNVTRNGKRILIVGAGPAGLSAAYHLHQRGYEVEIHDANGLPGGMLQYGIPAYRLPRDIVAAEISRLEDCGIRIILNHQVDDIASEKIVGNFDAVFIAIGAGISKHIEIPTRDSGKILDAITLLHRVDEEEMPVIGRKMAVLGGGNTAIDAARTLRRLGADDTVIIYRRDAAHMSALPFEVKEALTEGIRFAWMRGISSVSDDHVTVEKMQVGQNGNIVGTGEFEEIPASALVLAIGQDCASQFLDKLPLIQRTDNGNIQITAEFMTGAEGIFCGGDATNGMHSVTAATGMGKKAAAQIDAWCQHTPDLLNPKYPKHPTVSFEMLHLPVYSNAVSLDEKELNLTARLASFDEVISSLTASEAHHEAKRCLSCGNCYECDSCLAACPQTAITKNISTAGYDIHLELCTGCAVCVDHCPAHAMEMVPEPISNNNDEANAGERNR